MRLWVMAAILSSAAAVAWIVYGVVADRSLDATGGPVTLGFCLVMAAITFAAIWLFAFFVWTFRVYRRSRAVEGHS